MNSLKKLFLIIYIFFIFVNKNAFGASNLQKNFNIILISVCSFRPDHLGCFGYSKNTSPNLDNFAKNSVIFKNAFSNASYTLPSLISLHSSLYPDSHGVYYIAKDVLSPKVKTLAEILYDEGYETASFLDTTNLHTEPSTGLGRGFAYLKDIYLPGNHFVIAEEIEILFNWLKRVKNKNFFIFYHNRNMHTPYLSSLKYKRKFAGNYNANIISSRKEMFNTLFKYIKSDLENYQSKIYEIFKEDIKAHPEIFQGEFNRKKHRQLLNLVNAFSIEKKLDFWHLYGLEQLWRKNIDKNNFQNIEYPKGLYDACVFEFDDKVIKKLMYKLKKLKLYNNTMIIIIGDHGEEFNEHGNYWSHSDRKLYDELIRVPLIIKLPGHSTSNAKYSEDLVQSIDIMPTILDILNIEIPQQAQGKSLKGILENKEETTFRNEYVYAQNDHVKSIRSKEHKLIFNFEKNKTEFYFLKEDAIEKNDLSGNKIEIIKIMEEDFYRWRKSLISYADETKEFSPEINEATKEGIKRTGYW